MSSDTLLVVLVYAVPLFLLVAFFLWRRDRTDRSTLSKLAEAKTAGLDVPPSIHPFINPSRCLGCAVCATACPEKDVLGMVREKAVLITAANCVGHGACKDACPTDAIHLVLGTKEHGVEVPVLHPDFQTNLPGVFVAGELGGMGLIRNAIEQGRQVMESVRRLEGMGGKDRTDVVIVGAGPAGFSATLAAKEHGLRARTLEQDSLGGAVAHYPRRKLVLTAPVVLPMVGPVKLRETTKEALLEMWTRVERETGVRIDYGEKVTSIEREANGFVVTSNSGTIRCRAVVLAIGRRGSPRRLGAEGENLPKVVYLLEDPADHRGSRVLVVGAGDSAVEAAVTLSDEPGTQVTLSCRGDSFPRAKPLNRKKLEEREQDGRIRVMRKSTVEKVEADTAIVRSPEGAERIGNDAVIVCIGGELPFGFLREVGVRTEMKHGEP
jgi:thioredoxin reductase/Pyruvate/2-oxoacid:ferredoxin oxidoreductase delta subunit